MDFSVVVAASVAVNRFVEFVKPQVQKLNLEPNAYNAVMTFIAVLTGILIALLSNGAVNIFTGIPVLTPIAGQILTGVLAGFGADVLNAFISLLYGWRDNVENPSVTSK